MYDNYVTALLCNYVTAITAMRYDTAMQRATSKHDPILVTAIDAGDYKRNPDSRTFRSQKAWPTQMVSLILPLSRWTI